MCPIPVSGTLYPLALTSRLVTGILPEVSGQIKRWRDEVALFSNAELSKQAALSLQHKRFHCQGGAVYALYHGKPNRDLVRLIVALQTISDYLDNLCDRAGCDSEAAFRLLHRAMICAVDTEEPLVDFYARYPFEGDGGYLQSLVNECRNVLCVLPSYQIVRAQVRRLAVLYSDLQVYKHIALPLRESRLKGWFSEKGQEHSCLAWWEFAAATGSTLGMFALLASAARPGMNPQDATALQRAYFPWITGLHILLDYFIDQDEDEDGGDLNFFSYYPDATAARDRIMLFLHNALKAAAGLPNPALHRMVVRGLPALYLSDPKAKDPRLKDIVHALLCQAGFSSQMLHRLCRVLRSVKVI